MMIGKKMIKTINLNKSQIQNNKLNNYFGEIPGLNIGDIFQNRMELSRAGVHRPPMAGIWGSQNIGAYSIVLSGGYEDDIDNFDYILYTGQGGQDVQGGKQIKDQEFTKGNRALAINKFENLPVRVVRGHQVKYGPQSGYRYDGIYYVKNTVLERGISGYFVYRYELISNRVANF